MRNIIAGAVLAMSVVSVTPVLAQSIEIGPGGAGVDLRSRGQRERDFRRDEGRRDRDYDRPRYREQRYNEDRGYGRRGYDY